ncbi:MAG: hypothetical protein QOI10_154 [Solirubrobacterales bacterium]|nr:hypothetical protein [Solirubrobacterales bacterium]
MSGSSSKSAIRLGLCACALALVGAAVAGAAGSGLTEVSESFQLDAGDSGFVRVVCPAGKAAIMPGFETQVTGGARIVPEVDNVFSARRLGLTAENIGAAPGTATGYIYCSNLKPGQITSESSTSILSPHESSFATGECPEGYSAIGGAFNTKPDAPVHVFESRKYGRDRWRVSGASIAENGEIDLEAQALCQQRKGKLRTETSKTVQAPTTATATASCEPSEQLISGGYRAGRTAGAAVFVYASRREGKRTWLASAFTETGDARVTAYAYCAPK